MEMIQVENLTECVSGRGALHTIRTIVPVSLTMPRPLQKGIFACL